MPEPKHVTHKFRDPAKAHNQRLAGMTKKQRARRERQLQAQLYNARINLLGRAMVNWFIADERGDEERLTQLNEEIAKLLKMMTWERAEKIRAAAEQAYDAHVLYEQNQRIMAEFKPIEVRPEPQPYTQEELDAFAAASE